MIIHLKNEDGTSYCGNEQTMDNSADANFCQKCAAKSLDEMRSVTRSGVWARAAEVGE